MSELSERRRTPVESKKKNEEGRFPCTEVVRKNTLYLVDRKPWEVYVSLRAVAEKT